jgi:hypothetical protein
MNNAVSIDYLEEQKNEIEALQSIYPEEFEGKKKKEHLFLPPF